MWVGLYARFPLPLRTGLTQLRHGFAGQAEPGYKPTNRNGGFSETALPQTDRPHPDVAGVALSAVVPQNGTEEDDPGIQSRSPPFSCQFRSRNSP